MTCENVSLSAGWIGLSCKQALNIPPNLGKFLRRRALCILAAQFRKQLTNEPFKPRLHKRSILCGCVPRSRRLLDRMCGAPEQCTFHHGIKSISGTRIRRLFQALESSKLIIQLGTTRMERTRLRAQRLVKLTVLFQNVEHGILDFPEREPCALELSYQVEHKQVALVEARIPRLRHCRLPKAQTTALGVLITQVLNHMPAQARQLFNLRTLPHFRLPSAPC